MRSTSSSSFWERDDFCISWPMRLSVLELNRLFLTSVFWGRLDWTWCQSGDCSSSSCRHWSSGWPLESHPEASKSSPKWFRTKLIWACGSRVSSWDGRGRFPDWYSRVWWPGWWWDLYRRWLDILVAGSTFPRGIISFVRTVLSWAYTSPTETLSRKRESLLPYLCWNCLERRVCYECHRRG